MFVEFYGSPKVIVEHANILPSGILTAKVLIALANKLQKFEYWQRHNSGPHPRETPFVRHIQGEGGKVTATVVSGAMSLKLALKGDDWIVLGDALKVSD